MQYRYILQTLRDKRLFALCHHQSDKVQRAERGPICLASRIKFVTLVTPPIPSKLDFLTIREQTHKILVCMFTILSTKKKAAGKRTIAQTL